MVNDLSDPLLSEWLTYHLTLGVQHFYIFDNRKTFPPYSRPSPNRNPQIDPDLSENSLIRPFLDANLITLIHFPFSPSTNFHWNSVQGCSFHVFLSQFGQYNHWVGLFDVDEFFFPSGAVDNKGGADNKEERGTTTTIGKEQGEFRDSSILSILSYMENSRRTRRSEPQNPIISAMFDSTEMKCPEENNNYYMAPKSSNRTAMSTHCLIEGFPFRQYEWINGLYYRRIILFFSLVYDCNNCRYQDY
jgi:hypothetical protein